MRMRIYADMKMYVRMRALVHVSAVRVFFR